MLYKTVYTHIYIHTYILYIFLTEKIKCFHLKYLFSSQFCLPGLPRHSYPFPPPQHPLSCSTLSVRRKNPGLHLLIAVSMLFTNSSCLLQSGHWFSCTIYILSLSVVNLHPPKSIHHSNDHLSWLLSTEPWRTKAENDFRIQTHTVPVSLEAGTGGPVITGVCFFFRAPCRERLAVC